MSKVGLLEVEAAEVLQGFRHLLDLPGWEEGQRVLVPFEVNDLAIQPDGVVGSSLMLCEVSLTPRRNPDLLSPFSKVEL